ncbi:MAG: gluconolaconase [Pseudomonadota bacterium]
MFKLKCLLSTAFGAALLAQPAASASLRSTSVWLPEGFDYPNGVAFTELGSLMIGSVVSGDIAEIALGAAPAVAFERTDRRFAGTALRYDAERAKLWVASPDFLGVEVDGEIRRRPHRLAVMDGQTGEVEWSVEMPDAGFPNDIALDGQGGAFVTDTTRGRVLHVREPGAALEIVAEGLESRNGALGPAGIAVDRDGSLIVGLYSDGRLVRVRPATSGASAAIEDIALDGAIANPDGMVFGPDGRLLVIDGGVETGNGRLLAVDLRSSAPHPVEVLISGLDLPVNLAVRDDLAAVTESRIRHRMVDDPTLLPPQRFRVVLFRLDDSEE